MKKIASPLLVALFFAAQWLGAWLFGLGSQALLNLWGVTQKTLPYAPQWLQTLLSCYGSLEAIAQGLFGFAAAWLGAKYLRKKPIRLQFGHILSGAGIGFGLSAIAFVLLKCTGSVRTMGSGSVGILSEILTLLGAFFAVLGPEALLGGCFFDHLPKKNPLWLAVFALLNALLYILSAYWTPAAIIGALAMSAACALLYWKQSFLAAAALRCAWVFGAHRIFGFSANGAPGIFFETYPVSRDWLTGGAMGLEGGWLYAILLCAACAILFFAKSNGGKASHEN